MTHHNLQLSLLLLILTVVLSSQSHNLPPVLTQANRLLQILVAVWVLWAGYLIAINTLA